MSNINEQLQSINSSVMDSVRVMELLGLSEDDFIDPARFSKFQIIMEKLAKIPNKELIVKRITLKKIGEDKLNLLFEYVKAMEMKERHQEELEKLSESKDVLVKYGQEKGVDLEELQEYRDYLDKEKELTTIIGNLEEEMSLYEN